MDFTDSQVIRLHSSLSDHILHLPNSIELSRMRQYVN
jgi:hypothetical protein